MDPENVARALRVLRDPRARLLGLILLGLAAFWALPVVTFEAPYSTVVFDRHGALLSASVAADGQWRFPPGRHLPARYRAAVLAFEDQRFAWHPGVDPAAVVRAGWANLRAGRVVSGASTLTMQVVRLARRGPPRTLLDKAWEALLAVRLELARSKSEIFLAYAAHAPFGGNVVGLEAATFRYFGREPEELTWAEAATLAVLPNSPALIHPGRGRELLQRKRDRVLRRLAESGELDAVELQAALLEPLPGPPRDLPQDAPHLMTRARNDRTLGQGRLSSTLDGALQRAVERVLERHHAHLRANEIHNAAAVVLSVPSGEALAYVGNVALRAGPGEHSEHVDIASRPRSTGSLLKPFLYAARLSAGEMLPDALVADIPTRIGSFAPENFSKRHDGAVSASDALARSLNVPLVRMLREYGVPRLQRLLQTLGMSTLNRSSDDYGLSLIVGGAEGTLWELTGMFASLGRVAQGGAWHAPSYVARAAGVEVGSASRVEDIDPGSAWLTLQALLEVARPKVGGGWRRYSSARPVAWKTGTSYGFRDGWAIGVTPSHAIGVWVGNADGEGRPGLTGLTAAAPLLFDLFDLVPASGWFEPVHAQLVTVDVCRHSGMRAGPWCTDIEPRGVSPAGVRSDACPFCTVIHCERSTAPARPRAGTQVDAPPCLHRVHRSCATEDEMVATSWFVLPAQLEGYFTPSHPEYRPLPPWREGCEAGAAPQVALAVVSPKEGSELYVPRELSGAMGRAVFEVMHRDPDATLFWHLDETFVGETQGAHQLALAPEPGEHLLTVVDADGERATRRFRVLGRPSVVAERY